MSKDWYYCRQQYINSPRDPPPGWRCLHCESKSSPCHLYQHDPNTNVVLRYPLLRFEQKSGPVVGTVAKHIYSKTSKAYFMVSEETLEATPKKTSKLSYSPAGSEYRVILRDEAGCWGGLLHRHNQSQLDLLKHDRTCELVAISSGYASNDSKRNTMPALHEWHLSEGPGYQYVYHFYNVLWIEWKDGIAYRRAIGCVKKSVWDAQNLEPIDSTPG